MSDDLTVTLWRFVSIRLAPVSIRMCSLGFPPKHLTYTLCVMESRPDGRAVSVCEPSARSCEHTHVPMGYPPITLAMPW